MESFQALVLKAIEAGSWQLGILAIAFLFVLKLSPIMDFVERLLNRRYHWILESLKLDGLELSTKEALTEELNRIIYLRATRSNRISSSRLLRQEVEQLLRKHPEINRERLRLTGSMLNSINGKLVVQLSSSAKVERAAYLCLAVMCALMAFWCLIWTVFFSKFLSHEFFVMTVLMMYLLGAALFCLLQSRPYGAAKALKADLERVGASSISNAG